MSSVKNSLSAETRPVRCSSHVIMYGAPSRIRDDHAIGDVREVLHPLDLGHAVLLAERHRIEAARRRADGLTVCVRHMNAEFAELRAVAGAQEGLEAIIPCELALQMRADRAEQGEAHGDDFEVDVAARRR